MSLIGPSLSVVASYGVQISVYLTTDWPSKVFVSSSAILWAQVGRAWEGWGWRGVRREDVFEKISLGFCFNIQELRWYVFVYEMRSGCTGEEKGRGGGGGGYVYNYFCVMWWLICRPSDQRKPILDNPETRSPAHHDVMTVFLDLVFLSGLGILWRLWLMRRRSYSAWVSYGAQWWEADESNRWCKPLFSQLLLFLHCFLLYEFLCFFSDAPLYINYHQFYKVLGPYWKNSFALNIFQQDEGEEFFKYSLHGRLKPAWKLRTDIVINWNILKTSIKELLKLGIHQQVLCWRY